MSTPSAWPPSSSSNRQGRCRVDALSRRWSYGRSRCLRRRVAPGVEPRRGQACQTEVRDLAGRFVMPGLTDVHNHHALAGRADLFEVTFSVTATLSQILDAVRAQATGLPVDAWVIGGSWGSGLMSELATHTARFRLDEAAGGRAVLLTDDSHHNRWVSSRALEIAGVTASAPDPEGGQMLREDGPPTGVMLEAAGRMMEQAVPESARIDAEAQRACSRRGSEILHRHGITAFQDAAVSTDIMATLKSLDDEGLLDAWVVTSMLVNDLTFGFAPIGEELCARGKSYANEHHRPTFVKIFLDGVPPARTGAFLHPYLPDAHGDHYCGEPTMSPDELLHWMRLGAQAGLSAKVHCTGDKSVHMVLDAVERLRGEGFTNQRHHIARGQFIAPDDLPRLAALGIDADISPFLWVPGVIPQAIAEVLPPERAARMQPNRDLLDSGALVAGGSDWPVSESPNVFEAIAGLVTRQDPTGTFPGALWPEQAVTREEAIEIFSVNGATAMGLGDITGTLTTGRSADFVMLDRDITAVDPTELLDTTVEETWFAGRQVYAGSRT
ncbi:amidohydrolase [Leekyejoonella antrihumi]|uniref:Amidohydrolase family protein n=1 Tax=Leekyejoonella antrihumi TaxID=1660198 RepID=A0A563DU71_9MICO|nr:amidohydrolase [Leekyejoonella antrihumi]TWP33807.1 amidohydrolase family protein [Leekyejoonella antrihumi]